MSQTIRMLTDSFAVAPQLTAEDMPAVSAAGFKSVIVNRPDYEGGPDQPLAAQVIAVAKVEGMEASYLPVVSGAITQEDVVAFAELLKTMPKPILAYCRSGGRCTQLFQAASALDEQ